MYTIRQYAIRKYVGTHRKKKEKEKSRKNTPYVTEVGAHRTETFAEKKTTMRHCSRCTRKKEQICWKHHTSLKSVHTEKETCSADIGEHVPIFLLQSERLYVSISYSARFYYAADVGVPADPRHGLQINEIMQPAPPPPPPPPSLSLSLFSLLFFFHFPCNRCLVLYTLLLLILLFLFYFIFIYFFFTNAVLVYILL